MDSQREEYGRNDKNDIRFSILYIPVEKVNGGILSLVPYSPILDLAGVNSIDQRN